ncbi:hypothetical protein M9H77_29809 [Catharanthus roseus]|uniref:Uncharacterized protein n=1 Tax=Catharanthus roseus TaxID=4058 RepID=A0ACB9ZY26_CATRO|nr:hypothetical protein M9H77_29809 [Catharanthus roseus]
MCYCHDNTYNIFVISPNGHKTKNLPSPQLLVRKGNWAFVLAAVIFRLRNFDNKEKWEKHKGAGFILEDPNGHQYTYAVKFLFPVSNNESKYRALLEGFCMAHNLEITHLRVRSDSQVVIGRVTGDLEFKEDNMQKYLRYVLHLTSGFQQNLFEKIPQEENVCADMLSKLSSGKPIEGTWMESLQEKCVSKEVGVMELSENWTQPIKDFILEEKRLEDEKQARNPHHFYKIYSH